MREFVFATENPGKLREVNLLANSLGFTALSPSEAGLESVRVAETGTTYEENARLKVEAYLGQPRAKELVICGDDSGIEIDALDGAPGIHSRRWIGREMSDQEIIDYTLEQLKDIPEGGRQARFRSTLAYSDLGGEVQYTSGVLEGYVATEVLADAPIQPGFPFRSLFMVKGPERDISLYEFDELSPDERSGILSHREQAFKNLFDILSQS